MFSRPFAGILVADYSIVHRCKVDVLAVHDPNGPWEVPIPFRIPSISSTPRSTSGEFFGFFFASLLLPAKGAFLTSRIPERNDLRKLRLRSRRSLGEKLRR